MRHSHSEPPYYVALCASLASNLHGFPGHAYVILSETLPFDSRNAEAFGFVPSKSSDQIPALCCSVPGFVVTNSCDGNMRNLDTLVAIVDRETYLNTKQSIHLWESDRFKVGSRDCVAFTNLIAHEIGLVTPDPRYKYPQDYIRLLKSMNHANAESPKIVFAKIE